MARVDGDTPSISPEIVTERRRDGDADLLLLDIRRADEFDDWYIPDSTNIAVYDTFKENPDGAIDEYERILGERGATLTAVLETHAHADHISGATTLAAAEAASHYLHPADTGARDETAPLDEGDELRVGDVTIGIVHTPGHTPGSVTFAIEDEALLTGDTLFLDSVGRPDLDGGTDEGVRRRADTLFDSLQRLLGYPSDVLVAPAHDPGVPDPPTTASLGALRDRNALLTKDRSVFIETEKADFNRLYEVLVGS